MLLCLAAAGMLCTVRASADPPCAAPPCPTIVFVADGAGGRLPCGDRLQSLAECGCPLQVISFPWTHGHKHNLIDQTDWEHSQMQGQKLAELILACRQQNPHSRICVLGYCAGCGVALAAAGHLPPDTIDEMVLLAPSVSPCYDLRPALRAIRCRLTAFCSHRDYCVLGLVMYGVGTTDRCHTAAAGFVGFRRFLDGSPDDALYDKLCERYWRLSDCWLTHYGGHFGYTRSKFMNTCVLPALLPH